MVSKGKKSGKTAAKRSSGNAIEAINPNAAGIDIGSERHYVAVPADRSEEPVRNFGCYTPDLHEMADWLQECGVTTVAMESTGVYWIPAFQVLKERGFDVKLADVRHMKNVPGRKTDVVDCQWIQQLHSYGLLRGCFIPEPDIAVLREYWRHRASLVESASREILHMQKSLEQMNLQLHKAIRDITGVTGMHIIRAILAGERNPVVLAAMREPGVKKSEEEIAKALTGYYREDHLFTLKQAVDLYDVFHEKMRECDEKIEQCLSRFPDRENPSNSQPKPSSRSRRKNEPYFDLAQHLFRMTGIDVERLDGISALTLQTVISEVGYDMEPFPSEGQFASWMTLSPNNRITGGRVKKRGTNRSENRAANALRIGAQSLHHSKSALGAFFRRIQAKHGTAKAITATAHKLAILIYRMLKYGMEYVDQGQQEYERRYQEQEHKRLQKKAAALGYVLVCAQTGEVS